MVFVFKIPQVAFGMIGALIFFRVEIIVPHLFIKNVSKIKVVRSTEFTAPSLRYSTSSGQVCVRACLMGRLAVMF